MSICPNATSERKTKSASMTHNSPPPCIKRFIIIFYKLGESCNCVPIELATISGKEHNMTVGQLHPEYQVRRLRRTDGLRLISGLSDARLRSTLCRLSTRRRAPISPVGLRRSIACRRGFMIRQMSKRVVWQGSKYFQVQQAND